MPYLLAAEADKIQDFIFRSSRLREVVGASQLLTRFCRSVEDTLARQHNGQVVVNDGGSFRIIFLTRDEAIAFGNELIELYRLVLGSSLTVAEPVELSSKFTDANEEIGRKLRWAKSRREGIVAEVHMPYVAFCASCGVALAEQRGRLGGQRASARSQYLCAICRTKTAERDRTSRVLLEDFYQAYCTVLEIDSKQDTDWPEDTDDVAAFDLGKRNYVAYLVADGNGMGQIFGMCDQKQIKDLSNELAQVLHESLAVPAAQFRKAMPGQAAMVPILPLILGGDDLFALIPAPYALDFARQFCLEWEKRMSVLTQKIGLIHIPRPTIAAAVVICKNTYPYALAHRRAETLLKEAKRQSKLLTAEIGEHLSAVNFEVILGNRLAGLEGEDNDRPIRASLRPYWVAENSLPTAARQQGIELKQLLEQRIELKDLPNKRLAELRHCFEDLPEMKVRDRIQQMSIWTKRRIDKILSRVGNTSREKLEKALESLGKPRNDSSGAHHWLSVTRNGEDLLAHGIPDLLEVWDFAQTLDHSPDEYAPQEEEA